MVNIHWFGAETLSINDLAKIKSKVILTLHDMWAFCGSEHYVDKLPIEYFFLAKKILSIKLTILFGKENPYYGRKNFQL